MELVKLYKSARFLKFSLARKKLVFTRLETWNIIMQGFLDSPCVSTVPTSDRAQNMYQKLFYVSPECKLHQNNILQLGAKERKKEEQRFMSTLSSSAGIILHEHVVKRCEGNIEKAFM